MSDAEESYFVRWRGKVTGPYAMAQLKEFVTQGRLSRLHDLSVDQVAWQQADVFGTLYPKYERRELERTEAPARRTEETSQPSDASPQQWYYSIHGSVEGPCSTDAVRELIGDGTISGSDYVSRLETPEDWRFVMEVPEFDEVRRSRQEPLAEMPMEHDSSAVPAAGRGLAVASLVLGIVGICVMPLGILAIIFSGLAKSRMNRAENYGAWRLANTGMIIGIVDLALWILMMLAVVFLRWPPIPGL